MSNLFIITKQNLTDRAIQHCLDYSQCNSYIENDHNLNKQLKYFFDKRSDDNLYIIPLLYEEGNILKSPESKYDTYKQLKETIDFLDETIYDYKQDVVYFDIDIDTAFDIKERFEMHFWNLHKYIPTNFQQSALSALYTNNPFLFLELIEEFEQNMSQEYTKPLVQCSISKNVNVYKEIISNLFACCITNNKIEQYQFDENYFQNQIIKDKLGNIVKNGSQIFDNSNFFAFKEITDTTPKVSYLHKEYREYTFESKLDMLQLKHKFNDVYNVFSTLTVNYMYENNENLQPFILWYDHKIYSENGYKQYELENINSITECQDQIQCIKNDIGQIYTVGGQTRAIIRSNPKSSVKDIKTLYLLHDVDNCVRDVQQKQLIGKTNGNLDLTKQTNDITVYLDKKKKDYCIKDFKINFKNDLKCIKIKIILFSEYFPDGQLEIQKDF